MEETKIKLPIFVGIKITEGSRNKLIQALPNLMCDWVYLDHITLEYNPTPESEILDWVNKNLGRTIPITVKRVGWSFLPEGNVYALEVECEGPCRNRHKHITIGTTGTRRPVDSNMISEDSWCSTKEISLVGVVYRKERG